MQKRTLVTISIGAVLILIGLLAWATGLVSTAWAPMGADRQEAATTTEQGVQTPVQEPSVGYYRYGAVTLPIDKAAGFESGSSMRVLEVFEDSRCPKDVQCIQAGTVRLSIRTNAGDTSVTQELALGDSLRIGGDTVMFASVSPEATAGEEISAAAYRFTFEVAPTKDSKPAPAQGQCYVGGCSSQLCSDQPDMVSTCEYRAEYACYQGATCERQPSGQCGWTQNAELKACLLSPPAL